MLSLLNSIDIMIILNCYTKCIHGKFSQTGPCAVPEMRAEHRKRHSKNRPTDDEAVASHESFRDDIHSAWTEVHTMINDNVARFSRSLIEHSQGKKPAPRHKRHWLPPIEWIIQQETQAQLRQTLIQGQRQQEKLRTIKPSAN